MSAKKITPAMLPKANACPEQVAIFRKAWPSGVRPTLAACRKAISLNLNVDWASQFLSPPAQKAYNQALATAFAAAWKIHEAQP